MTFWPFWGLRTSSFSVIGLSGLLKCHFGHVKFFLQPNEGLLTCSIAWLWPPADIVFTVPTFNSWKHWKTNRHYDSVFKWSSYQQLWLGLITFDNVGERGIKVASFHIISALFKFHNNFSAFFYPVSITCLYLTIKPIQTIDNMYRKCISSRNGMG